MMTFNFPPKTRCIVCHRRMDFVAYYCGKACETKGPEMAPCDMCKTPFPKWGSLRRYCGEKCSRLAHLESKRQRRDLESTERKERTPQYGYAKCQDCGAYYQRTSVLNIRCLPCHATLSESEERALAPSKGCFNCAFAVRDRACASKWRCTRDQAFQCKPWIHAAKHQFREAVSA